MKKIILFSLMTIMVCLLLSSCITWASEYEKKEAWDTFFADFSKKTNTVEDEDSVWMIDYFVDEFGTPTSDPFVKLKKHTQSGYFSNSATNNSDAYIIILGEKYYFCFELFEYSSKYPVSPWSGESVKLKVQTETGEVLNLGICSDVLMGKRFAVKDENFRTLMEAMTNNSILKFRIEIGRSNGTPSVYRFDVNTKGFLSAYQEAFLQESTT